MIDNQKSTFHKLCYQVYPLIVKTLKTNVGIISNNIQKQINT